MDTARSVEAAIASLNQANFASGRWEAPLAHLADAIGGRSSQLVGWLGPQEMLVNLFHNMPDDLKDKWIAYGGADPRVSPLIARGIRADVLEDIHTHEEMSVTEMRRNPVWADLYYREDIPYISCAVVWRQQGMHLAVATMRTNRQGPMEGRNRQAFQRILPHWREAALLARAIKDEGARLVAGLMGSLSITALVLDGFGQVVTATPSGETLLAKATLFRLKHRVLQAANAHDDAKLLRALKPYLLMDAASASSRMVTLRGVDGSPRRIRITAMPQDRTDIGFGARVLVIVENARPLPAGLTPSERAVAAALLEGRDARAIAADRGVSVETIRSQVKSIYGKAGVGSQLELMRRFGVWIDIEAIRVRDQT